MPVLLWTRDLQADASGVKNTFSSWDACMTKDYCKIPAFIGIAAASLLVASLLFCLTRCVCCGAECCCGCLACCNACCPSPRRQKYRSGPPPVSSYQGGYGAYGQGMQYTPQVPSYVSGSGGGGHRTATLDAHGNNGAAYNEDALPAMPSWNDAPSHHVAEDVEMGKLDHHPLAEQQETLLPPADRYYGHDTADVGDLSASPYHSHYDRPQQSHMPYGNIPAHHSDVRTTFPPTPSPVSYNYAGHVDAPYEPQQAYALRQPGYRQESYAPSVPPSYRTQPPSFSGSPPPDPYAGVGRRPVAGSWREV